jgi:shikimate kinase
MKLLIIGNIAAGKSTFIAGLKKHVNYPVVSIDELRAQHGDGSIAGEYLAWHHFLKRCAANESMIVEFSGAGTHKQAVSLALKESTMQVHVVFVDTSLETCKARMAGRKWSTPYPRWGISTEAPMPKIHAELETDAQKGFWSSNQSFTFTRLNNDDVIAREQLMRAIRERA